MQFECPNNARSDVSKSCIVVVCPNPAIEVTYFCERLVGHEQNDADCRIVAGGKGTNVAKVLATLNADLMLLACVGGKLGELYQGELSALGIKCGAIRHERELRIS